MKFPQNLINVLRIFNLDNFVQFILGQAMANINHLVTTSSALLSYSEEDIDLLIAAFFN